MKVVTLIKVAGLSALISAKTEAELGMFCLHPVKPVTRPLTGKAFMAGTLFTFVEQFHLRFRSRGDKEPRLFPAET